MSDDEVFVTAVSVFLGPIAWAWWFFRAAAIDSLTPRRPPVPLLAAGVGFAGLLIFAVLARWSASDVRGASQYLFMYFVLGLAWLRMSAFLFPLAGLNARDDVIERRNPAALPAWFGAVAGVACCYAGGNVGEGPGWFVVVFAAGLATAALGGVWLMVGHLSRSVDLVTIDRDTAAGWRLGGLLAACGLVFGAAVMGDWVAVDATIFDFVRRGWIALPIVAVAIQSDRALRPTVTRPAPSVGTAGVVPAVLFIGLAIAGIRLVQWLKL